jgi:hypothetical protein
MPIEVSEDHFTKVASCNSGYRHPDSNSTTCKDTHFSKYCGPGVSVEAGIEIGFGVAGEKLDDFERTSPVEATCAHFLDRATNPDRSQRRAVNEERLADSWKPATCRLQEFPNSIRSIAWH